MTWHGRSTQNTFLNRIVRTVWVMLFIGLGLAALGAVVIQANISASKLTGQIQVLADILGNRSIAALVFSDRGAAQRNLETARFEPSVELVCLYNKEGALFADYKANNAPRSCNESISNNAAEEASGLLIIGSEIQQENIPLGTIIIHANKGGIQQSIVYFLAFFAFVVIVIIGSITASTKMRLQTLMRPLNDLYDTAREVAENTLSEKRAKQSTDDEVGELVRLFNQMLDNIAKEHKAVVESEHQLRQIQQELKRLLLEHESIMSTIPDVAYKLDTTGHLVWWNRRFEEVSGLTPEQLQGKHGAEFFIDEDKQSITEGIREIFTNGVAEREAHFLSWQGPVLYHFNGAAVKDYSGKVIGATGIGRDVSAQRQAEQSLRESEQRFAISQQYSNVGTFEWNIQTNKFIWSQQMWNLAGLTPDSVEISLEKFIKLAHPDDREYVKESIMNCVMHGVDLDIEYRIVWPDGSIHWERGRGDVERGNNGQPTRMLGVLINIDSIKATEIEHEVLLFQLQQAQKMEAIGQLTGGIAHDFNNMLASILGFTTLIQQLPTIDPTNRLSPYLQQIQNAGERARDLIAQLLTFSRGGKSHGDHELQPLNVTPLLKEAIKMLRPMLSSSIEIKITNEGKPPLVMANPVKLHQVIMNLCINARDAMGGQGVIEIGVRASEEQNSICSSCHRNIIGDFVEISVSDTGTGIKGQAKEHLFEPFYTTKELGKGTGMGLAMVHGIIHDHDGHIIVDNTQEGGAVFRLLFPVPTNVQPRYYQNTGNIHQPIQNLKKNILVVDDEVSVATFLEELLTSKGFSVKALTDSPTALRYFKEHQSNVDLVITDQTMPGMTGMQLATSMIKIRPDLPIILCTGYSELASKENTQAVGIKGFLRKPVNVNELFRIMGELLGAACALAKSDVMESE